jgi:hypothetical protein
MGVPFTSSVTTPAPVGSEDLRFAPAGPPARSGALTWSAIYFYAHATLGALAVLSIIGALAGSEAGLNPIGLLFGLAFASPFLYGDYLAGRRIWQMDPKGRGLGMLMSGIGIVSGLAWSARGIPVMFFSALLAAVVFYYLWTTDDLSR